MTALGLVAVAGEAASKPSTPASPLQAQFDDAIAGTSRLWIRGRIGKLVESLPCAADVNLSWWRRWWKKLGQGKTNPAPKLTTRIGGMVIEASLTIGAGGHFEIVRDAKLPLSRRGWRIARHHVTWSGHETDVCNVVHSPAPDAAGAVAVLLPIEYTYQAGGPGRMTRDENAIRLAKKLHELEHAANGRHALYYLAAVPTEESNLHSELTLATISLGWPAGIILLLPAERNAAPAALASGLDRLRWLFAGMFDPSVVNLEPSLNSTLPALPEFAMSQESRSDSPKSTALPAYSPAARQRILRPARSSLVTRWPLVFCHGMLAFSTLKMKLPEDVNCFAPLREFLRERGFHVLYPQVAPTSGVAERAEQLRDQILRWTDEPVNVIAHSMGGLDARHMISRLGMAQRVRSLTTISTPHRGTYLADWFLANFRQRVPLMLAMEAMGVNMDGFRDCRPAVCAEFNACTPDPPGVPYFSFVGEVAPSRLSPALRRGWNLLTAAEGPNDGMISVRSSRWGECLGVVHADHFAQTPDAVFLRPGEDFDCLGFYYRLVEDLARRGY